VANEKEPGKYDICGHIEKKDGTTIEITELPIQKWTQDYKEFLEGMMPGEKKSEESVGEFIEDFREYHTENTVHFVVTMKPEKMKEAEALGLDKVFKMKSSISTTNMFLFDAEGKIAKYETALDILTEHCKVRRTVYEKRKDFMVSRLTKEKEILSNKARFILMVVNEELELRKKKKDLLLKELQRLKFTPMSELNAIMKGKDKRHVEKKKKDGEEEEGEEGAGEESADKSDYDYLLGMNLWSLTQEKVDELKKQLRAKEEELALLKKKSIEQFWDEDLTALSACLDDLDLQDDKDAEAGREATEGRRRKDAGKRGSAPAGFVVKKRVADRGENKLIAAPLVANAADNLGAAQKSISGLGGENGPTRFSAADIPLEDQQAVARDPDIIQRPAKAPRVKRAPTARQLEGGEGESHSPEPAAAPPPAEESGGSLLARMLAKRSSSGPAAPAVGASRSAHAAMSTGADFFFGSSTSLFSNGLPEPEPIAGGDTSETAAAADTEPAAKKAKKAGKGKKVASDDDDDDA